MPNWCFTEYRCCGKKGELVDLKEKLDHLNSLPAPLVDNGFGKLWCGCLVSLLGGDWYPKGELNTAEEKSNEVKNEVYCRGEIVDYGFFGCTLNLTVMSAWSQLEEWRKFLKSKYPNIKIYYPTVFTSSPLSRRTSHERPVFCLSYSGGGRENQD